MSADQILYYLTSIELTQQTCRTSASVACICEPARTISRAELERRPSGAGEDDMDANLADNIRRKGARFREKDLDADDEYDFDVGIDMYESRKKQGTKVCGLRNTRNIYNTQSSGVGRAPR